MSSKESGGGVLGMILEEFQRAFIRMKDMVEKMYYKDCPCEEDVSSVNGGDASNIFCETRWSLKITQRAHKKFELTEN